MCASRTSLKGFHLDREVIRLLIRSKLASGSLPYAVLPRVFGGPGAGQICEACNLEIRASQLAIEGAVEARKQTFYFHSECFYLWDDERIGARDRRAPSPGAVIVGLLTAHGPLCLECLAQKSGSATTAIREGLERIGDVLAMTSAQGLCSECRRTTVVYSSG